MGVGLRLFFSNVHNFMGLASPPSQLALHIELFMINDMLQKSIWQIIANTDVNRS
jgi:hypothetical protein